MPTDAAPDSHTPSRDGRYLLSIPRWSSTHLTIFPSADQNNLTAKMSHLDTPHTHISKDCSQCVTFHSGKGVHQLLSSMNGCKLASAIFRSFYYNHIDYLMTSYA